jgi:hypothetical protein
VYLFSVNIAEDGTFASYSGGGRNRWIDIITAAKKTRCKSLCHHWRGNQREIRSI